MDSVLAARLSAAAVAKLVPATSPQSQGLGVQAPKSCTVGSLAVPPTMSLTRPLVPASTLTQLPARSSNLAAVRAAGRAAPGRWPATLRR